MSPGPPPPPRLLRDVREGYPRLSGSGGRGRLRPHATRGWPGRRVAGLPSKLADGFRRPTHTHAPRAVRPAPWPAPRPLLPSHPAPPLSQGSHPLTPTPCAEPGPAPPVTRRGRAGSKMATPPPPPPHSWRGQGAPSRGGLAPEARLKIIQARLYLVLPDPDAAARTPPRPLRPAPPRALRPAPPRAALNGEGAGVTEGNLLRYLRRAPAAGPGQPPNLVTSPASITRLLCVSAARLQVLLPPSPSL